MTEESITSSYVRRERCTTAMLTPFMPCGTKLPVIALFASVFFADAAWVGTGFVPGLIAVVGMAGIVTALILRTQRHMAQSYALSGGRKGKVTA